MATYKPSRQPHHKDCPPTVRLAHVPGAQGDHTILRNRAHSLKESDELPAILISFFYWDLFEKTITEYLYRDLALDSGAFSAHMIGATVSIDDYIDLCKRLRDMPEIRLAEVFSLDVIGDWRQSLRNAEKMWKAGIEAIPTFHGGEPWHVLIGMAKDYPKIALGGVARAKMKVKQKFAEQCFARVWPKAIHGFGYGHEDAVLGFPFHSTDASNWELGPCCFGRWKTFGEMSVRGGSQNLRAEVEFYLALERKARYRWRHEMEEVTKGLAEWNSKKRS